MFGRQTKAALFGVLRVAVIILELTGGFLVLILDPVDIISTAEGAPCIIALLLQGGQVAGDAAEKADHLRKSWEISFDIFGVGGFLNEDLGNAGSGGLEADLGQFGGVIAAEVIDEVVLVEAILSDYFLLKFPIEETAGGPVGDVAFFKQVTNLFESGDDVLVRDTVGEHAVDHVAMELGQLGNAAFAAGSVLLNCQRQRFGLDDSGELADGRGLEGQGWLSVEQAIEGAIAGGGRGEGGGRRGRGIWLCGSGLRFGLRLGCRGGLRFGLHL